MYFILFHNRRFSYWQGLGRKKLFVNYLDNALSRSSFLLLSSLLVDLILHARPTYSSHSILNLAIVKLTFTIKVPNMLRLASCTFCHYLKIILSGSSELKMPSHLPNKLRFDCGLVSKFLRHCTIEEVGA